MSSSLPFELLELISKQCTSGIDLLRWIRACKGVASSLGDLQFLLDLSQILEHTEIALGEILEVNKR
jgi:hypothetical protein